MNERRESIGLFSLSLSGLKSKCLDLLVTVVLLSFIFLSILAIWFIPKRNKKFDEEGYSTDLVCNWQDRGGDILAIKTRSGRVQRGSQRPPQELEMVLA